MSDSGNNTPLTNVLIQTRACTMTRTVTAQSWTIQAVQSPASLQPTGENTAPQPTQTTADVTSDAASCVDIKKLWVMVRDVAEKKEMKVCLNHIRNIRHKEKKSFIVEIHMR